MQAYDGYTCDMCVGIEGWAWGAMPTSACSSWSNTHIQQLCGLINQPSWSTLPRGTAQRCRLQYGRCRLEVVCASSTHCLAE